MYYKKIADEILRGNDIRGPGYDLSVENHDEHSYPVDDWYWFDDFDKALIFFGDKADDGITVLQGLSKISSLGKAKDFLTLKESLDPEADFDKLAFINNATKWYSDDKLFKELMSDLKINDSEEFFSDAKDITPEKIR
jgi:hypothetical protein